MPNGGLTWRGTVGVGVLEIWTGKAWPNFKHPDPLGWNHSPPTKAPLQIQSDTCKEQRSA